MKEYEVNCITKPDRFSAHEHITHIGNTDGKWTLTREAAIRRIDSNEEAFYTIDNNSGRRAEIGVVREIGKAPFLRTYADGVWNDNLLAQRQCSADCKLIA
jgi:Protein of unknown function (DUF3892)